MFLYDQKKKLNNNLNIRNFYYLQNYDHQGYKQKYLLFTDHRV